MDKLQEALAKLDPKNDAHWTAEGLPKLDTVRMLAANPAVTRELIEQASPGLTRASVTPAAAPPTTVVTQPTPAQVPTDETQTQPAASETGTGANGIVPSTAPEQVEVGQSVNDRETEIQALESEISQANEALSALRDQKDEAVKQIMLGEQYQTDLVRRLEAIKPKETLADGIQLYLASQRKNLMERARLRLAVANSGINLKELGKVIGASPLDQRLRNRPRQR